MDTRDASRSLEAFRGQFPGASLTWRPRSRSVGAAVEEQESTSSISLKVILRGILRYKWLIFGLWVVLSVAACGFIYFKLKPTYSAISQMKINLKSSEPFENSRSSSNDEARELETNRQLVTSSAVLDAVLIDPAVLQTSPELILDSPDPIEALRDNLNVTIVKGTTLINVALQAKSSSEATSIVNAVVDAFINQSKEWSATTSKNKIARLTKLRDELSNEADDKKAKMAALFESRNVGSEAMKFLLRDSDPEAEPDAERDEVVTSSIEEVKELGGMLYNTQLDLAFAQAELDTRLALIERNSTEGEVAPSPELIEARLQNDPDLMSLNQAWLAAYNSYSAEKQKARNPQNDPVVKSLIANSNAIADKVEALTALKREQFRQEATMSGSAFPVSDLTSYEIKVMGLKKQEELLKNRLSNLEITNSNQQNDTLKLKFLEADATRFLGYVEQIDQQIRSLDFANQEENLITLIDAARETTQAASDKRLKMMLAAPPGLLMLLLAIFGLMETRSGRVGCPDDLSKRVKVEVFSIPVLPQLPPGGGLLSLRGPGGPNDQIEEIANRLDHLRVALCEAPRPDGRAHCVLITSAVGGEGKTTLAAQLAARCADAGALTLLIDADLRRASLGRLFDVTDAAGLGEVLRGEADLEDVLLDLPQVGGCKLLAAGGPIASPGRVLQGAKLSETIERLRSAFDVILIDTPPVLPVPDALTIGRFADGALLATRHDESRLPLLEQARRLLDSVGLPLMGVVVNGVRPTTMRHSVYAYQYASDRQPPEARDVRAPESQVEDA